MKAPCATKALKEKREEEVLYVVFESCLCLAKFTKYSNSIV